MLATWIMRPPNPILPQVIRAFGRKVSAPNKQKGRFDYIKGVIYLLHFSLGARTILGAYWEIEMIKDPCPKGHLL